MLINFLCAGAGLLIGALGTGIATWQLIKANRANYNVDYYDLDPIEVKTPSYDEVDEFEEAFDGWEASYG